VGGFLSKDNYVCDRSLHNRLPQSGPRDCLFCGSKIALLLDPNHTENCEGYKKIMSNTENRASSPVVGSTKRLVREKEVNENVAEDSPRMPRVTPNVGYRIPEYRVPRERLSSGNKYKKRKTDVEVLAELDTNNGTRDLTTLPIRRVTVWACLACGDETCGFESGATIMNQSEEKEIEYDPRVVIPRVWYKAMKAEMPQFDQVATMVNRTCEMMYKSKGMFESNKYIGKPQLDTKIEKWAVTRLVSEEHLNQYWPAIRDTVALLLRLKRQMAVQMMFKAFLGKSRRHYLPFAKCNHFS
jgi:hypothetical protein